MLLLLPAHSVALHLSDSLTSRCSHCCTHSPLTAGCVAGTHIRTIADAAQLNGPNSIVLDKAGRMFVADSKSSRVQVYSMDANAVAAPGKQPLDWTKVHTAEKISTPRQHTDNNTLRMSLPCQLAVDGQQNNLMVADTNNHRVLVIRLDDTYDVARQIGCEGSGSCEFRYPWGVAVDGEDNRLVVVDTMNNRCLTYVHTALVAAMQSVLTLHAL